MPTELDADTARRVARAYHQRTKHRPERYARALGYMDWDTQPDPFREWTGAPRTELPHSVEGVAATFGELHRPSAVAPRALDAESLGAFLELSLGITAWKEYEGVRWALRADPSSGNLHPTEGYVVVPDAPGLASGLHHYVSRDHVLEHRAACDVPALPRGAFLVGVASIHWRESWKYGERAWRYCQHDAGHVIACLRYAAAALGWTARLCDGASTAAIARLCGLDRDADFAGIDALEREHADTALLVGPPEVVAAALGEPGADARLVDAVAEHVLGGAWSGKPNVLSSDHVAWEVIEAVAAACAKPAAADGAAFEPTPLPARDATCAERASAVIRRRRSAVQLDGRTTISASAFFEILDAVLPRAGVPPFDALPWRPRVHLLLFVHRVDGVPAGLYVLERDADVHPRLEAMLGPAARWERVDGAPDHLRLFRIAAKDCRRVSAHVSCGQDIAADGAFSAGMLARFAEPLDEGAHLYPRLFWECGVIGQALYLEAEAHGVRGTGIGCFFDDPVHDVLGLEGDFLQSLYHFTLGGPVDDARLTTLPAYGAPA